MIDTEHWNTEHWDTVYADRGERGVSWFTETPALSLDMLDAAHVGPERSLVDVGAGASRLVDAVLARGHTDVTALDVSEQGLAVAQKRLGAAAERVHWVVSDLLAWRPGRTFGLWHDRAVFHFLRDPDAQARYLALLDSALQDDGIAVIGTFAEDGPTACSGLPTARYSPNELLDALGGNSRWVELARRREHHTTPSGADQSFIWLALRRRPI
ncbi:class I SAM-dependent methyltransferase [Pseudonocardia sp. GCM10023141]|uniref:class I SAM-dependent methyltransferase n=1 Tax=Pseudonocardia sp. GCM10023141 TaxID=3252653 RepID=UPI00361A4D3F